MELTSLKELGIAVASVGVIGWICTKLIQQLAENRKDYSSFVMSNNHTNTELIRECTATIIEVKNSIQMHNELTKNSNIVMEKLLDKLG